AELYDVPREAIVTQPDGEESQVQVMETVFDEETDEEVVINDITQGTFEVYASVGPSFQSQKDEARAEMRELYTALAGTPEGNLALLTYFTLLDGPKTDHLKKYARKQLILQGIMEPQTEEEEAMLQQAAQQQQQPDPNMLLAMAEQAKAEADMAGVQAKAQHDNVQSQIDMYKAETQRLDAMAKAQKTGVETAKISTEIRGTELDNLQKLQMAMLPPSMRVQQRRGPTPANNILF